MTLDNLLYHLLGTSHRLDDKAKEYVAKVILEGLVKAMTLDGAAQMLADGNRTSYGFYRYASEADRVFVQRMRVEEEAKRLAEIKQKIQEVLDI